MRARLHGARSRRNMDFRVRTADRRGNTDTITLSGATEKEVRERLLMQDIFPVSVEPVPFSVSSAFSRDSMRAFAFRFSRSRRVIEFARVLSLLLKAGMSINEAFDVICSRKDDSYFGDVMLDARKAVVSGIPLSIALSRHPAVFDDLFVRTVASGESAGNLSDVLANLRVYFHKMQEFRKKLVSAAIYPIIVLILSLIGISYLFVKVVPTYVKLFSDMNAQLPPISQAVFFIADIVSAYFAPLILLAAAGAFVFVKWLETDEGRGSYDRFTMGFPMVRGFTRLKLLSIFYRTSGLLIASGVNIITAFEVSSNVITSGLLLEKLRAAIKLIKEGNSISRSFETSGFAEDIIPQLVKTGEESGTLAEIFGHVADEMDSDFDALTTAAASAFGPILLVFVLGVFAVIVLAILLPMITASSIVG